jgi:hypothetical protein
VAKKYYWSEGWGLQFLLRMIINRLLQIRERSPSFKRCSSVISDTMLKTVIKGIKYGSIKHK